MFSVYGILDTASMANMESESLYHRSTWIQDFYSMIQSPQQYFLSWANIQNMPFSEWIVEERKREKETTKVIKQSAFY